MVKYWGCPANHGCGCDLFVYVDDMGTGPAVYFTLYWGGRGTCGQTQVRNHTSTG